MEYEVIDHKNRTLPDGLFKRIDAAKRFRKNWLKKHRHIKPNSIFIYKMFQDKDGLWYGETL